MGKVATGMGTVVVPPGKIVKGIILYVITGIGGSMPNHVVIWTETLPVTLGAPKKQLVIEMLRVDPPVQLTGRFPSLKQNLDP